MGKGIGKEVVVLVVAVIFGGVIIFILFKFVPNLINSILFALGVVKPNDLENAIRCAIHRCVDGCMNMEVYNLEWKEGDKTISCQSFCLPEKIQAYSGAQCKCLETPGTMPEFGMINKVCNYNCKLNESKGKTECEVPDDCIPIEIGDKLQICGDSYPVNITIDKPQTIDISHILLSGSNAREVDGITTQSNQFVLDLAAVWEALMGWTTVRGISNVIVVDKNIITSYGKQKSSWPVTLYESVSIGKKGEKTTIYIASDSNMLLTSTRIWAVPTS
jgi:hypothetical protein